MKTKTTALSLAVLAAVGLASSHASAEFVETWDFDVDLEWLTEGAEAPTFDPGTGTQEVTSERLSWGSSEGDIDPEINDQRSGLQIIDSPSSGSVDTGDEVDTVGVTHFNSAIASEFATLDTATLMTNLILTPSVPPVTGGEPLAPLTLAFKTTFEETPNTEPCGFESATVCDDIFTVQFEALDDTFTLEGVTYKTTVVEEGLGFLDDDTCAAAGEPAGCYGLTTPEGEFTTLQFGFGIEAVEVPNPAMLALFGTGLLALGAVAGRRRRED
ncbi:THxN family PEP-CTERM protein [Thioalkalivibrio sp. AKL17]|uniref:THxN family PEP-CTERM protein n=1 Tax=Thioalkalivibrio sp. AKL17 TaxID=1158160 RepID=UPI00037C96DB|nr:THxN family PEP-CTERM protein [Thioalkalivibrio sp. AKL17]